MPELPGPCRPALLPAKHKSFFVSKRLGRRDGCRGLSPQRVTGEPPGLRGQPYFSGKEVQGSKLPRVPPAATGTQASPHRGLALGHTLEISTR